MPLTSLSLPCKAVVFARQRDLAGSNRYPRGIRSDLAVAPTRTLNKEATKF